MEFQERTVEHAERGVLQRRPRPRRVPRASTDFVVLVVVHGQQRQRQHGQPHSPQARLHALPHKHSLMTSTLRLRLDTAPHGQSRERKAQSTIGPPLILRCLLRFIRVKCKLNYGGHSRGLPTENYDAPMARRARL
ncbi:hypothetical protein EVAR_89190_1 [Eumeta japonica]|uniref:Uncharacterized protein n=1 Tax=Eumeta variegata TaxID=151549 RepID=A0A4C1YEQ9_EUMVA|nr:hypothetical protein EVAR_89190_1 [Eumeta japonica]